MNEKQLTLFLKDLLTPHEHEQIVERWQIIKLLNEGNTQRKIAEKLKVGIATVTRGAAALKQSKGGFKAALDLTKNKD